MPIYSDTKANQVYKDPSEVIDIGFDYQPDNNPILASGETISTSVWSVESGLTEDSESETTTTTTIWLSGGTAGTTYRCENTITTSAGRTIVRSITVVVRDR